MSGNMGTLDGGEAEFSPLGKSPSEKKPHPPNLKVTVSLLRSHDCKEIATGGEFSVMIFICTCRVVASMQKSTLTVKKGNVSLDFGLIVPKGNHPQSITQERVLLCCYNILFLLVSYKKYKWDQTLQPADHPSLKSYSPSPTFPLLKSMLRWMNSRNQGDTE